MDDAKKRLTALEAPIPEPDPVALARMKYEIENRTKTGVMHKALSIFAKSPDMTQAAKSGAPNMEGLKPSIPVSVPVPAQAAGSTDVTIGTIDPANKTLENNPDARLKQPDAAKPDAPKPDGAKPEAGEVKPGEKGPEALPTNRALGNAKPKKYKKPKVPKGVQ